MSMKVLAFHDVSLGFLGHGRGPWEKKKTRKKKKKTQQCMAQRKVLCRARQRKGNTSLFDFPKSERMLKTAQ
jgi:hypothetical protein